MKKHFSFDAVALTFVGLSILVAALCAFTCEPARPTSHTTDPSVIMEVIDPSLQPVAVMWQQEIGRRFPHSVGVLVHGGDFVRGQWIVGVGIGRHFLTTQQLVEQIKAQYPDRTVVLLACNTGHLKLNIPGVFYATSSVWCVPDRFLSAAMFSGDDALCVSKLDTGYEGNGGDDATAAASTPDPMSRSQHDPEVVGNIFEFVQD